MNTDEYAELRLLRSLVLTGGKTIMRLRRRIAELEQQLRDVDEDEPDVMQLVADRVIQPPWIRAN